MGKQLSYVIIGNGISGVTAAETIRAQDATGRITIIADAPFPVYYRPALKDYLAGRLGEEKLWARPHTFYREQRIRFLPGRAVGINTIQQTVCLHTNQQVQYDKLLLAHGARPRQLACPGVHLAGVTTLRTVADYQQVLSRLQTAKRVVVCGGGTLALESAETLCHQGYEVTHLLRNKTFWSEILDEVASDLVLQEECRMGISVRTNEEIAEIVGSAGQVTEVITSQGTRIPCEIVLIAIGIEPTLDFVQASGINCNRGIIVDNAMRTNMPHVYAAGDVIETIDPITGRVRLLGQWYPAIKQARIAAHSMLGESYTPAIRQDGVFYNATFLCGLDFVAIGHTTHLERPDLYQSIVAEPRSRNYRKVILQDGVPLGALLLGERTNGLAFKRAIDHKVNLTTVASQLFAEGFNLDAWLDAKGVPPSLLDSQHDRRGNEVAGKEVVSSELRHDFDAYLVSLPHPQVSLDLPEIQLPRNNQTITIGRLSGSTLQIEHTSISRKHAQIIYRDNTYLLRDLGSSNGTFVNGVPLLPHQDHQLRHQDIIRLGDARLRVDLRARGKRTVDPSFSLSDSKPQHYDNTHQEGKDTPRSLPQAARASGEPRYPWPAYRPGDRTLNTKHTQFEIDMCIGCDRCMAVCPVPLSSMISIASLNHATIAQAIDQKVVRFTHECILCGSCVPVCPVDNHRDLLMLALKRRLGTVWDIPVDPDRLTSAFPPGWEPRQLAMRLKVIPLFSDVAEDYLLHLLVASRLLFLLQGDVLVREGEYGRDLYIVLDGTISLTTSGGDGSEFSIAVIGPGEYVGEYGMLTGQPYLSSARAQSAVVVLQIPEQVIQHLMELEPTVRRFFDQLTSAHSVAAILRRMALFQGVREADIQTLATQARITMYDRSERLFAEDDQGGQGSRPTRETLHLILEGFVKVARHIPPEEFAEWQTNERVIAYRQSGDYFAGGLDLLGDGRAVTVTTINRARVAEIPRRALLNLFQEYPEVEQRFMYRLREYIESAVAIQGDKVTTAALQPFVPTGRPVDVHVQSSLHSLVTDGVVEGTEVLIIDLDKCIHCSECEAACERRHGHSRLNRKGMIVGNISIANACRQCQDPVCLLCSRAGIARRPNGEVYITESCIGCGICAERCPYGAITIVEIGDEPISRSSWQRFNDLFAKGPVKGRERKPLPMVSSAATQNLRALSGPLHAAQKRDAYDELRKKVAIKCDLCVGYRDQACVEACPTGAALRVQPTKFFGSTEDILRRQAF